MAGRKSKTGRTGGIRSRRKTAEIDWKEAVFNALPAEWIIMEFDPENDIYKTVEGESKPDACWGSDVYSVCLCVTVGSEWLAKHLTKKQYIQYCADKLLENAS